MLRSGRYRAVTGKKEEAEAIKKCVAVLDILKLPRGLQGVS
jgi:hypothetical protein